MVDCRGMQCPLPVISVKKVLDGLNEGEIIVLVDNFPARENVLKLAVNNGCGAKDEKHPDYWRLTITKTKSAVPADSPAKASSLNYLIGKTTLGHGAEDLGETLIKSFFYAMGQTQPLPAAIIFINSGVYLACQNSSVLEQLQALNGRGVEILSCGACLSYYKLEEKLAVGGVTNMYAILEKMNQGTVITL